MMRTVVDRVNLNVEAIAKQQSVNVVIAVVICTHKLFYFFFSVFLGLTANIQKCFLG